MLFPVSDAEKVLRHVAGVVEDGSKMKILRRDDSTRHLRTPDNLSYKTQYSFCSLLNGCYKDGVSLVEMWRNASEWQGKQQETDTVVLYNTSALNIRFYAARIHIIFYSYVSTTKTILTAQIQ